MMVECEACGQEFKSKAALGSHRRFKHSERARKAAEYLPANRVELDRTLKVLFDTGKIEGEVDAARVAAVRSLAVAVDIDPGDAALWREYRQALAELFADDDSDGKIGKLLESLRSGPEVGDQAAT